MGLRDDFVREDFIHALQRKIRGFQEQTPSIQARLAFLVWDSGSKRRAHRACEGYASYSYKELEQRFGRGKFTQLNKKLDIFRVTNWVAEKNLTRGYRPRDHVIKVKADYLKPKKHEVLGRLIGMDGRALRKVPNVIAAKDANGITAKAWRKARLVNLVPVDVRGIKALHDRLRRMLAGRELTADFFIDPDPSRTALMIDYLGKLIKMAHTDIAGQGFVIHRYFEASTGRLYARGISLQTVPKEVKKAALHGLYEYDFENCHYDIFNQMAAGFGHQYDAIEHYLKNKKAVRRGISERIDISNDDVKACLIGLMYGAKTSEWWKNAIPKLIGDKASALYKDPEFSAIAADVRHGRALILKNWPRRRPCSLVNDIGKPVSLTESPKIRLAHLIQGVEAKALRRVVELFPGEVVLPMHDGFVAKKALDRDFIEREVLGDTTYRLRLSGEIIVPSPDLGFPKRACRVSH